MSDIVTFLRARLDEDEQVAHACAGTPWVDDVPGMVHVDPKAIRDAKWKFGYLGYVATANQGELGDAYRAHIARHDPARVLADVDAKRRLLETHEFCNNPYRGGFCEEGCVTLELLALPYASHEDYDESWRP